MDHDPAVVVVDGVDHERPQGRLAISAGRRDLIHDSIQELLDADAGLARDVRRVGRVEAEAVLDFLRDFVRHGRRKVDLVQDGDDLEVTLDGEVAVGDGLGLDTLGRVHEQDRALAGGQAARDLVVEVDVAGGVDEVQLILDAVLGPRERDADGLDRDPALALEVHSVEVLVAGFALADDAGDLEHSIGQGRLAVVDVRDDREVANAGLVHMGGLSYRSSRRRGLSAFSAAPRWLS